ncbi:hypothetical protein Taro_000249, partial [Colocasia esculenta]|nr:hypothetical protein [Colocasia esculenta]
MPYPQNLHTAREVEAVIRENGAIPATVAILHGVPCIGREVQKTARRDIPHIVATGRNGATTVSATMFFASMVGIHIFVTGGIGGVHRHGEQTMDVSSDLTELGRTPVAVVSAGVKSILDIPRTLEFLETQGVTVATYKTNEFPAFFTETSGSQVSWWGRGNMRRRARDRSRTHPRLPPFHNEGETTAPCTTFVGLYM